ncbi:MAG: hypothetical protein A2945_03115 [Candidatus Liptonbacteria bacterium RIFCSPLOWO2_01_FULL_52_25]|uniref:Uncharacterized protein n=1 Tax=Candidatus Liptonbacteria bacterium RIFCSPLOWO2_01_FULL_52_25 TaxID=1798650 RepID=A0A1G2CFU3_9BACT|nr:MAG: hypothetical protein A2945_03115 [Candidatus Liptonbacteria bacterium RIFCSPLOWO2_01_FULL_52_25]
MNKTFSASLRVGRRIRKTMPHHTLCKPPLICVIPPEPISKVCFTPRFLIFSPLLKARRGRCTRWYSDEVITKRSGKIAKTLRDTANFARHCVASDSEYQKDTLSSSFLAPDEICSYRGRRYLRDGFAYEPRSIVQ